MNCSKARRSTAATVGSFPDWFADGAILKAECDANGAVNPLSVTGDVWFPDGTVAVDDTILVKGCEAKAGSHILDGFVPLFSSDAVERLVKAGFTLRGKTHTGEFGLDIAGETSYHGVCKKADGTVNWTLEPSGTESSLRSIVIYW